MNAIQYRAATRILAVRNHRDITQHQLGEAVGLSQDAVCRVETQQRQLKLHEAVAICAVLGIEIGALVAEEPLVVLDKQQFE